MKRKIKKRMKKILNFSGMILFIIVICLVLAGPLFFKSLTHQNIMSADNGKRKVNSSLIFTLHGYKMNIYGNGAMSENLPDAWRKNLMDLSTGWRIQIKSAEIKGGVTYVSSHAFVAASLDEVKIAKSVTKIGEGAFSYCDSLHQITYKGTKKEWKTVAEKSPKWNYESSVSRVKCTDGIVKVQSTTKKSKK